VVEKKNQFFVRQNNRYRVSSEKTGDMSVTSPAGLAAPVVELAVDLSASAPSSGAAPLALLAVCV
jgi:hypothetical protein